VLADDWLARQRAYQTETYQVNYTRMAANVDELTDYVTMNLHAAFLELGEAAQETPWKPWAKTQVRHDAWARNRDAFVGELVDVLFFVANALAAVDCDDDELRDRYAAKMALNKKRQADGYDGENKCQGCGRALDETQMIVSTAVTGAVGKIARYCSDVCRDDTEREDLEKERW